MFDDETRERKEKLKSYFKKLGEIINDTLTQSQEIQDMLNKIKEFGFGVDLSMVIGLGLYSKQKDTDFGIKAREEIKFELTEGDRVFLDENKIIFGTNIEH